VRARLVCAIVVLSSSAHAGGLYFSDRGVRPLARGGAFVAGADDLGAMWYNPAGLVDAQGTFLADASLMLFSADFQRRTTVVGDGGALQTFNYPSVHGDTPPLAIPTLGIAFPVGEQRRFTWGLGAYAPYAPLLRWPETIQDTNGNTQPSPSRYGLVSLEGSLLAILEVFGAYKISEQLRVGAGLQALTGVFQNTVDLAANPNLLGAPQDPNYDALTRTRATIFTPSANFGVTWIPHKLVRFGLSGQLPFWIDAPASVRVRLPNAAVFDNGSQVGEDASVKFRLPAHIRAGVEVRPVEQLRVELAWEHQFWSLQDTIDITPHGIALNGVVGFPTPYYIPTISIQRHFQDCDSVRLGGEYTIDASASTKIHLRLGFAYETSAVPAAYESPLTVDGDKFTFAGGIGVTINRTRLDATFAYVMMSDVDVDPSQAALSAIQPVSGYPLPGGPPYVNTVNGGHYSAGAPIIGLGFQYAFDITPPKRLTPPPPPHREPPPPPPPPPPVVAPEVPVEVAPETKPPKKPKKKKPKLQTNHD
jgi:long-chain fatty acid transport protein